MGTGAANYQQPAELRIIIVCPQQAIGSICFLYQHKQTFESSSFLKMRAIIDLSVYHTQPISYCHIHAPNRNIK